MRVVLAGGGSAGHIEPALALADALREADSSIQVTCLGTQRGLDTRLVPLRGYELELVPSVPLPRTVTPQLLTVPGRLAGAVHTVGTILDRVGADVLVGFGGYVATPAYLAAKRHKVPIVVHEANPQGAMSLTRALSGAVSAITSAGVQVLHVTGPRHLNEIQAPPGPVPYVAVPYVDRMDLAYAAADFALCRGGAMTCAELTAVGLPAAYVPLPHGNGEQRLNAAPIEQAGGGLLVADADLSPAWIRDTLLPVLLDPELVAAMSAATAELGRGDADRRLAAEGRRVIGGRGPRPAWRRS